MPFKDLTGDPNGQLVVDGLAETLVRAAGALHLGAGDAAHDARGASQKRTRKRPAATSARTSC